MYSVENMDTDVAYSNRNQIEIGKSKARRICLLPYQKAIS